MSGANLCSHFLVASRRVATQGGTPTDRGCSVLTSGDYHLVQNYDGKTVWEGSAHCKYCARAEAISKMGAEGVDGLFHKTACLVESGRELASDEICGDCGQPAASGHAFNCQHWVVRP